MTGVQTCALPIFSPATTNDELALNLAQGLSLTPTGTGVVLFTQIKQVFTADCTAQALGSCGNANQFVIVQRLKIGNGTVRNSTFGTPGGSYVDAKGNISPTSYLTIASLVATNTGILPAVAAGNSVYATESYFQLPALQYLSPFGTPIDGIYSICFF